MQSNENYEPKKLSLQYRKIYCRKGNFFVDSKVNKKLPSHHKARCSKKGKYNQD